MKTNMSKLKDVAAEDFEAFYTEHVLETRQLIAKCKHLISIDETKTHQPLLIRYSFTCHRQLDADREYQHIAEYKKSTAYEKKNSNIDKNKIRLAEMTKRARSGQAFTKDENAARTVLQMTINIDENDKKATDMDYDYYLENAMKNYLKCIILESDTNNSHRFHIIRVFSLWLANKSNATANATIAKYVDKVASHKFVPLLPQITTHLSPNVDDFSKLIKRIVRK